MTRTRVIWFGAGALVAGALGCRQAPPAASVKASTAAPRPRVVMDSAEIDRLCAEPDSVRRGLVDCVLKDQAPRLPNGQRIIPTPP